LLEEPAEGIYKRICSFPLIRKRSEKCKRVFDKEFIEKIFKPTKKMKNLPEKWSNVLELKKQLKKC
jgi:hypothetical protein